MSTSHLPPDIRTMPIAQRLELAEQIWDSIIEDEAQFELSDARKAELDRRLARHADATDRGSSWQDVKKRILSGDLIARITPNNLHAEIDTGSPLGREVW